MKTAIFLVIAYILGSINFSILLFRVLGEGDPRDRFSGNAGTTNIYRQTGIFWAAVVLLLDLGRSAGLAWAALHLIGMEAAPWAGLALIIGNRFPCFHQFKGGKGVASYLGFTLVLAPLAAALSALAWVIAYGIGRIPFIASFFMVAVLAGGTVLSCGGLIPATVSIATALFIIFNHRKNVTEWRELRANHD